MAVGRVNVGGYRKGQKLHYSELGYNLPLLNLRRLDDTNANIIRWVGKDDIGNAYVFIRNGTNINGDLYKISKEGILLWKSRVNITNIADRTWKMALVIHGNRLYTTANYYVDLDSGDVINWSSETVVSNANSIAVADDIVYYANNGRLYYMDKATGSVIRYVSIPNAGSSYPFVVVADNEGNCILCGTTNTSIGLCKYDKSGNLVWKASDAFNVYSKLDYDTENDLICLFSNTGSNHFRFHRNSDGNLVKTMTKPAMADFYLHDDCITAINSPGTVLYKYDRATGEELFDYNLGVTLTAICDDYLATDLSFTKLLEYITLP